MGLLPTGAVPGGHAERPTEMGLLPTGAVPGGHAERPLGALRRGSPSDESGRRFTPALTASSGIPAPNSWSGDELSSCPGTGVRGLSPGSEIPSSGGEKHGWISGS